jgi:hypothetical protein
MSSTIPRSTPNLRLATFEDYSQVSRLEASNEMESSLSVDDWRNLWLQNPVWRRVRHGWPIGWVLETERGQIVGSLFNVPSLYCFQGQELICANGRGWVVAPDYRGLGLWMMGEYFGQSGVDLFVNTTVGPNAVQMIESFSECVPLGDFQTVAYRPIRYRRLAEKQLRKMGVPASGLLALPAAAALRIKGFLQPRPFPSKPASVTFESAVAFDRRFDAFWAQLVRQNPDKLLGSRDSTSLAWHYSASLRQGHVWILTASRQGLLRAYCVLKRTDLKLPIRRMRMVDFQTLDPHDNLLRGLLQLAYKRAIAEGFDVIEHLGCGLPKMHDFEVFAPYRVQAVLLPRCPPRSRQAVGSP